MPPHRDAIARAGALPGARLLVFLLAGSLLAGGCARNAPEATTVLVGHHRVRLVDPPGWEHLDHGREQLFRNRDAETELSLVDLGPVPTERGAADSLERVTEMVLRASDSGPGREIVRQESRPVRGATWRVVDAWSRVSHMDRKRVAWLDDGGYVLALRMKRGDLERTGPVFEALLQSIEAAPDSSQFSASADSSTDAAGAP